jgi:SNF2 family DNA or RNA helicase
LWGTLNWLRPDLYTSYWRWVAQYWQIESTRFSAYNLGPFLPGGEDRLANDLRAIMLRRTKAEVLPELPPKQYGGTYLIPGDDQSPHGVWLDMTPAMAKHYAKFEAEGTVKLPGGWVIANGTLAERTRKLQLASSSGDMDGEEYVPALPSPHFDWLVEKLEELEEDDERRFVVSSHSTSLLVLYSEALEKLGILNFLLTGRTPAGQRQRMAASFQSDEPGARVFLINAKAGGVAITLDKADELIMLDESTIPDDDEQMEDRIHRTSRMHQVIIWKLRALGTIQEEVAWIASAAEDVQKYILDGSRGVEYARQVYQEKSANREEL